MSKEPKKESVRELSEEEFGRKMDFCMADTALKIACGAAIGTIVSLVFSRKTWPIWLGTGIGIGRGWSNCNHALENPSNWHYGKKWKYGNFDMSSSSTYFSSFRSKNNEEESSDQQKKETKP